MDGLAGPMMGSVGFLFFLIFLFDLLRWASNHLGKCRIYRDVGSEAVGVARLEKVFL